MELNKKNIQQLILGITACITLYWVLHEPERIVAVFQWAKGLVQPFLVGGCIAFIINVPMRFFENLLLKHTKLKGARGFAVILTLLALVLVVVLVVVLIVPQVENTIQILADQLPDFFDKVGDMVRAFLDENPQIWTLIETYTDVENFDWATLIQQAVDLLGNSVKNIFGGAVSAVSGVVSTVWNIFISLIFAIYCLSSKEKLARQGRKLLYAYLPENWADEIIRIMRLANNTFSNFLTGQCLEMVILGCMFAVVMTILGMPYVPLVSVLVGVTSIIPIVGAWIGCVVSAFFILVNDPLQAVAFVVMFLILQQIENNLIYPRVVGTSVGLPSMWVLVAVTVGGDLMGVAGMILMIPMASVLYTLLREYSTRRVERRGIAPEKLVSQQPVLESKLAEKRRAKAAKLQQDAGDTETPAAGE